MLLGYSKWLRLQIRDWNDEDKVYAVPVQEALTFLFDPDEPKNPTW